MGEGWSKAACKEYELVSKHSSRAWKKADTVIDRRTLMVPAKHGENLGGETLQGKEILGGA